MAAEQTRLDELRRRVQQDPASIAFAQLAEECRRVGELDEAVRVCRAGLAHHPAYLSAHVTLGRALVELGHDAEALAEFERVLRAAPDNQLARRCLDDIRGREPEAVGRGFTPRQAGREGPPGAPPADPVLEELGGWLAAIRAART